MRHEQIIKSIIGVVIFCVSALLIVFVNLQSSSYIRTSKIILPTETINTQIYILEDCNIDYTEQPIKQPDKVVDKPKEQIKNEPKPKVKQTKKKKSTKSKYKKYSEKDIKLIALVMMAEAEGECEKGKRLVIDTVLNRIDHGKFPNTARGVIYQKNQFSSMHGGRVKRTRINDEAIKLVKEEINKRTNSDVIFFRTKHYAKYGSPLYKVGNHYFSKY